MAREELNKVEFSALSLRSFAKERYGSLKGLADAMGISSQHIQAYLNGKREWGASFREKLAQVGYLNRDEANIKLSLTPEQSVNPRDNLSQMIPDIRQACQLLRCSAEDLAQRLGAPREQGAAWASGSGKPGYDQLVMLYHQILALAVHCCEVERHPAKTEERRTA